MKTYRFLPLLAAAMFAAGCAMNDDLSSGDPDAVQFRATIAQNPGTRTTNGGDAWENGDPIGIFMTEAGTTTTLYTNRLYTTSTLGVLTPDGGASMYYPDNGDVDFIAYYPRVTTATLGNPLTLTVTGQTDEDEQNDLDVLWARTPDVVKGDAAVDLVFGHVLSKITLNVSLNQWASGDVTEVIFEGMPASASLALSTGVLTSGTVGDIAALEMTTTASGAEATFTTLVVPQPLGGEDRTATFTVGGYDYIWNIPEDEEWEAGSHYVYPVTITASEPPATLVTVNVGTATINPWETVDIVDPVEALPLAIITTFSDGTTGNVTASRPSNELYEIAFDGTGTKTVHSVKIKDRDYLIGRKDDQTVTLKLNASGNVVLRDQDSDGNTPIGSFAELDLIRTALSRSYLQEADLDLLGAAPTPQSWTPIGYGATRFEGSYDGGGHTIANLYVDHTVNTPAGLFGVVGPNGKLSRIGIVSGSVTSAYNGIGGVCGYSAGTITACYNKSTVTGTGNERIEFVAGVLGENSGGSITACYNAGTVSATGWVAGVCGYNNSFGTIIACYNTGTVSGIEDNIGGVCGRNADGSNISACYNTGDVSGTAITDYLGSLCGVNRSTNGITDCWYLQRGTTPIVGGGNGSDTNLRAFAMEAWPADGDGNGGWDVDGSGTGADGNWKALSVMNPLGSWDGGGSPAGADSTFPRLWWE